MEKWKSNYTHCMHKNNTRLFVLPYQIPPRMRCPYKILSKYYTLYKEIYILPLFSVVHNISFIKYNLKGIIGYEEDIFFRCAHTII